MPYYKETVPMGSVGARIVELLTTAPSGANTPFWKNVNSIKNPNDVVLYSQGKNGQKNIFFRLEVADWYMTATAYDDYVPNTITGVAGIFTGASIIQRIFFRIMNNTSYYNNLTPIDFILSFDRETIMLVIGVSPYATGNETISNYGSCQFVYLSSLEPLKEGDDNLRMILSTARSSTTTVNNGSTISTNRDYVGLACLRDSAIATQEVYALQDIPLKKSSRVSGGGFFISDIYATLNGAARAKVPHVYQVYSVNAELRSNIYAFASHGDEFTINAKRYTFINPITQSVADIWQSNFSTELLLIEQL